MKKKSSRIVALVLTLCMVFFGLPVAAMAEGSVVEVNNPQALTEAVNNAKAGDVIRLTGDIEVTGSLIFRNGEFTLDLNGHTLSRDGSNLILNSSLIIVESSDNPAVLMNSLIITDSADGGRIVAKENYTGAAQNPGKALFCITVKPDASLTLKAGTVENTNKDFNATQVITNYGTVNIEGGTVKGVFGISNNAPERQSVMWTGSKAVCNISGGAVEGVPCESYKGDAESQYCGASYGVCLFGLGYTKDKTVDNSLVTLNINGGSISAIQAIGTNASAGKYAGYTINMKAGTVDGGDGTGMYLPAVGVTNISGGEITAAQAIRIAAGELNITGGTITCTEVSNEEDLVAGGSGGTTGAIVVGKAGNGYIGDIDVNISEDAAIRNTAEEKGVKPTIVVSDKNMADSKEQNMCDKNGKPVGTFQYSDSHTVVTVDGAEISGDVVTISNLSSTPTDDGGQTSLVLNDATVTGDVINQTSSTSLEVNGGSVGRDVKNTNGGSVKVDKAAVQGNVTNSGTGSVAVYDSQVKGSVSNSNGSVTMIGSSAEGTIAPSVTQVGYTNGTIKIVGKETTYTSLSAAISAAASGDTIVLGEGTFTMDSAITIGKNLTIKGAGEDKTTIQGDNNNPSVNFEVTDGNVVFQDLTLTEFGGAKGTDQQDGVVIEVPNGSSDVNLTVKNVKFTNFNRTAIDVEAGTFRIENCDIDCKNTYMEKGGENVLTKGIKVGLGSTVASGVITDVTIQGAKSKYTDKWSTSGIEVYQNGKATITNTTIKNCDNGVHADGYYSAGSSDTTAAVKLGDGNNISGSNSAVRSLIKSEATDVGTTDVQITGGTYNGPIYIDELVAGEDESNYVKSDDDNTLSITGGTFTNMRPEGMDEDINYITNKDNVTIKYPSRPSTSDDTPSLGYRLPYIGESAGGKNFVSDTTGNLTVNGKYQFRITSTDGHKPVMTVSNSNFTVELASQSGNDYFYVIRCAGAAGSTANVLVDGIHVVVATVGTAGVVSDTTHPFTVAQGAAYQFKLTSASRPTFTGNTANFTIAYVSNSGNDWFFKVTAVGAAGASTTFSANGVVVTTATIA